MSLERLAKLQIILSATDKMSRTINNAFGLAGKAFGTTTEKAKALGEKANAVAATTGAMGLALLAPLALAAEQAIGFEDKLADVAKTMNLVQGSKALVEVGNQAKDLAGYLAKPPTQVAELYAELAQGGAARNELSALAKKAGEVAIAFDITAGAAGEKYMKLKNALGATNSQVTKVLDSINYLSDKTASKAADILEFFAAGAAGATRALGLSGQQAAAVGSLYISMGKSGAEAATIFERMTKTLRNQDKASGKVFASMGGGLEGFVAAIEKGSKLSGAKRFEYFKEFGEYGIEVEQMANNLGMLQKHLGYVANAGNYANSVTKEFSNRSNTTAFRLAQAQANAQAFAIEIGTGLLPAINGILTQVTPVIKAMSTWAKQNPVVVSTIANLAAVLGSALLVVSAASKVVAIFNLVLAANPIVWVIAAVAALATAVYLVYKNWGAISSFFVKIWENIKGSFNMGLEWLKKTFPFFYNAGSMIIKMIWRGMKAYYSLPIKAIKYVVQKVRNFLPFSPAKEGPLKKLHKVRIVETIAETMKPKPIISAMKSAVAPIAYGSGGQAGGGLSYAGGGGGGGISINFSPNITMIGGGDKDSVLATLRKYENELYSVIKEAVRKDSRAKY